MKKKKKSQQFILSPAAINGFFWALKIYLTFNFVLLFFALHIHSGGYASYYLLNKMQIDLVI